MFKKYFSDISKYRHSDYGTLIISSIIGIIIGLFVFIFHEVMLIAYKGVQFIIRDDKFISWRGLLFLPVITMFGGLVIGVLRATVFKNITQEGIETVIKSMVYNEGKIDWLNSIKSIFLAAISISSGGGAGREGPTIVLGATIGSTISQVFGLKPESVRIFVGAGAAAAISAIFNAPLGGIIFATEAIIGDISIRSFVALVVSSVVSTATTRILVGDAPLIVAPAIATVNFDEYILLALAGILSGWVAVYFLKTYNATAVSTEKYLRRVPKVLRPAMGGLVVGTLAMMIPSLLETTYLPINAAIAGDGYALLDMSIIEFTVPFIKKSYHVWLFLLMAIISLLLKPISNAITLQSGSSGGTFAPAIKTGAMFGFVFGSIVSFIFPDTNVGLFSIVCAGAVLSGTFQAPLAGGIILFEISKNYELILPLVLSSVLASFIVQRVHARTFNALQKELVDDEDRMHPVLKVFEKKKKENKA